MAERGVPERDQREVAQGPVVSSPGPRIDVPGRVHGSDQGRVELSDRDGSLEADGQRCRYVHTFEVTESGPKKP
jgi:hypothetical protein